MIKLNIGCGNKPIKGYVNIDIQSKKADIHAEASNLPFTANSIDVIENYHLIEHMTESDAFTALQHWFSLLKPGGILVIECPDIETVMRKYLSGDTKMLYSVYGRHRYAHDSHLWGYSRGSLSKLLKETGFRDIVVLNGTDYHSNFEPCMRVEATK